MTVVKRGRGRPPEGERVEVRIPADLLADIDAMADSMEITRAAAIRLLLSGEYVLDSEL